MFLALVELNFWSLVTCKLANLFFPFRKLRWVRKPRVQCKYVTLPGSPHKIVC